jgi:hypothetical protein
VRHEAAGRRCRAAADLPELLNAQRADASVLHEVRHRTRRGGATNLRIDHGVVAQDLSLVALA